jgi:hypothetical protein
MRPISPPVGGLGISTDSRIAWISSSTRSGSFLPFAPKNLMPLSSNGLWEAEITLPPAAPSASTMRATAGVGTTPTLTTSTPIEASPAASAASSISPETRVSRPMTTKGRADEDPPARAACPSRIQ